MNNDRKVFTDSDPFLQFLRKQKGKTCYVQPFLGNSGDELIFNGVEELMKFAGLDITLNPQLADTIVWPGGNPTMWHSSILGWQEVWSTYPDKEFIIAPATFQGSCFDWQRVLAGAKNVTGVFARDASSYENLMNASLPTAVVTGLSHDPALFLLSTSWLQDQRSAATRDHILIAFRADKEANHGGASEIDAFLSRLIPQFMLRRIRWRRSRQAMAERIAEVKQKLPDGATIRVHDVSLANFQIFVEAIRRAAEVHTDRLHVMLFAAMLRKKIVAYPTSYGKLEAVFKHSLESWISIDFAKSKY